MKPITLFFAVIAAMTTLTTVASAQSAAGSAGKPVHSVAPAAADDAVSVQEALNRFDIALAAHDLQQLETLGVDSGDLKKWQRFFRDAPDAKVSDECPAAALYLSRYGTALWNCTETTTMFSGRKPVPFVHLIQFRFAKRNGEWLVAERK